MNQITPVCTPPGSSCAAQGGLTTPQDDVALNFQLFGGSDLNGNTGFSYQYMTLPSISLGTLTDPSSNPVDTTTLYAPATTFTYTPTADQIGTDSFKYQAVDNTTKAPSPTQATVNITVPDNDGDTPN